MSEPCSFFLRASIEKAQYLKFMQAKPSQPLVNDNWLKWWDSRQMYSKSDLAEDIRAWSEASNQEIVNGWLAAEDTLTFSEFNETESTWEFGIIMCSENYSEILPLLVFCESLSSYKIYSADDFAIIYPYFWGDSNVMAYATYSQEGFTLSLAESVSDVAKNHLDYAALQLGEKWKEFDAKMERD
jgi:hypothetical protein